MKKHLSVLLTCLAFTLVIVAGLGLTGELMLPGVVSAQAADLEENGFEAAVLEDGSVAVTAYTGTETAVVVPAELGEKKVTVIGDSAFSGNGTVKSVKLPEGVTGIGEFAFSDCKALSDVRLPESLTKIGKTAFAGCNSLKSLTVPAGVTEIGDFALGYAWDENAKDYVKLSDFTLYGKKSTAAEDYAKANGFTFVEGNNIVLSKPSKLTATQSKTSVKLSWTAVDGADGYGVYYQNSKGWKRYAATTGLTYSFNNLKTATKYNFAIRAYKYINGKVSWASDYTIIYTATKTVAPSKITSEQTSSAIKISWTKCAGASGYRIYYKVKDTDPWKTIVSTTTATTYTFKGLKAGARYTFAVRPYIKVTGGAVWSDYTTYEAATIPSAPASVKASSTTTSITLSWPAVNGATGYRVYQKVGSGWKNLGQTTKLTATVKNLTKATKYTFAVRPYLQTKNLLLWANYKEISTATALPATTVKCFVVDATLLGISWNSVSGANGYRVYYKTSPTASWKTAVDNTTKLEAIFKKLPANKSYTFAVRPYMKTASGAVWGEYKEYTFTTSKNFKIERYDAAFKSDCYYVQTQSEDMGLTTMAVKNGNMIMQTYIDDVTMTMLYKKSDGKWYMVFDSFKSYIEAPKDLFGDVTPDQLTGGELMDYSKVTANVEKIGGKYYVTETYKEKDGSVTKYYFNGNTLVRSDETSKEYGTYTTFYKKVTTNVSDSLFEIPKDYKYDKSLELLVKGLM